MLVDDGLLRFEDGTWRPVDDLADLTVPPTIQLLLAARIDRLDVEERAVIERGAVEGKVFHSGAVATLASDALRPNVPSRLLALARKELIRPDRAEFVGEDAFRFRHLLIRDAAYQAMPKEQRADLHERYAAWLERAAGDRLAEYEEILAHHLQQAYRYRVELGPVDERARELARRAARRLGSAAERAQQRGDFGAARAQLASAADLLEGSERARALVELAMADAQFHDFQSAAAHAAEAIAEAEPTDDRVALLRARIIAAESAGQIDPAHRMERTRREVEDALEELEALGDERGIVWGTLAIARSEFFAGRCDEATRIIDRMLGRGFELSARDTREAGITIRIAGYFGSADPDQLAWINDRTKGLMKVEGLLTEVMFSMSDLARASLRGDEAETVAVADHIGRMWAEIANPDVEITSLQGLGECMRRVGRLADAERFFRSGVEGLDRLGETGFNSTMTALLAQTLCDQEKWDEAEAFVERSRSMGSPDDFATQAEWRMALARILTARGHPDEALALADAAIEIVAPTDYLSMRANAQGVRGEVLAALGRVDEARVALEQAERAFVRKGSRPEAARVRDRLAALGD
jgi:tetratricopeptide (TPR) repeat protein